MTERRTLLNRQRPHNAPGVASLLPLTVVATMLLVFFLAEDRLVAVLKQVTVTSVAFVERDGVAGEKTGHQRGYRNGSGAKKEMGVVSEDRPCIA